MTITNARPTLVFSGGVHGVVTYEGTTYGGVIEPLRASTSDEALETLAILRDAELMRELEASLAEVDGGERLYSLEEVFGDEPPAPASA
jgi:hypothetical protein